MTNPAGETIQLNWCTCGSLSRLVEAEGRITAWYRDLQGRLTKRERPDLTSETYTYESKTSRLKSRTDAKGQVTNFTYNNDDTPAQISVTNVAAGTHAVPTVSFTWDAKFRRMTGWSDGIGSTALAYVPYNPSDTVYGDGKLQSLDGPWSNDVIVYTYDALGRTVGRTIDGSANASTVAYDSLGRVTTTTNNLGTFTYDYAPHSDQLVKITSSVGKITNFSYKGVLEDLRLDSIENLAPGGGVLSKFTYGYDPLSRITEWGQKQDSGAGAPTPWKMRYDGASRLTQVVEQESSGEGTEWNWRFDRAGNRMSDQVEEFSATASEVARQQYAVNVNDQLTAVEAGGPLFVSGTSDEPAKLPQAALPGRTLPDAVTNDTDPVTSFGVWLPATGANTATLVRKDWLGNTTTSAVGVTGKVPPPPTRALTYDLNGNLVQQIVTSADGLSSSTVKYEWDAANNLIAVEGPEGHRSEFVYDALGRRVKTLERNALGTVLHTRCFLWVDFDIVEERTGTAAGVVKRYYGSGEERLGVPLYYTHDHLGNLREVTDAGGHVQAKYAYDPYGVPTQVAGSDQFDFLYTGYFYHTTSGLHLAPYRAYDPSCGRWLCVDPSELDAPNHYDYAGGSPISNYDPDGLVLKPAPGASPQAVAFIELAITYLRRSKRMSHVIEKLESCSATYYIHASTEVTENRFEARSRIIYWNPLQSSYYRSASSGAYATPALSLAHELFHAYNWEYDRINMQWRKSYYIDVVADKDCPPTWLAWGNKNFENLEELRVTVYQVNGIAGELGEPLRRDYLVVRQTVGGPLERGK